MNAAAGHRVAAIIFVNIAMREAIYLFGNLISKGTATELMKSCIDLYWGVLRLDCLRPCGIACFGASVQSSSRTEMISTLHNSNEGCFSRFQSFSRAVVPQISPDGECLSLPQKNRSHYSCVRQSWTSTSFMASWPSGSPTMRTTSSGAKWGQCQET